jgi:hypothetical protein
MTHNLYKLTDQNSQTQNNTTWGENITHTAKGENPILCSDGLIHAYEDPLIAVFLNPIHGAFENPILWTAIGEGELVREGFLKCGCKTLTTIERISLPEVIPNQRVAFGILCALEVCQDTAFVKWANSWLDGSDRSEKSASNAAYAARAARYIAWKAAWNDASAAYAAAYAANAAWNAASAARDAAYAAENAANAADAARSAAKKELDLIAIAKRALTY